MAHALGGQLAIVHVPKTIDNDLPLPVGVPTYGFTTAIDVGKDLVRNLMKDAATTDKWFFVTIMGRHAGHLALGIGSAAGATLTVIGEEFPEGAVALDQIADILEGAIIKRRARGQEHGVALLAEGLIERLRSRYPGTRRARSLRERPPGGARALAPAQGARFREPAGARDRVQHRGQRHRLRASLCPAGGLRHPLLPESRLLGNTVLDRRWHGSDGDDTGRDVRSGPIPGPD